MRSKGHRLVIYRTREKEVLVPSSCNGTECPSKSELFESLKCEVSQVIDCRLSEWKEWSPCSENCGLGTSVRLRRLLTPAYCGGSRCRNETLVDSRDCESYSASRDCSVRLIIIFCFTSKSKLFRKFQKFVSRRWRT